MARSRKARHGARAETVPEAATVPEKDAKPPATPVSTVSAPPISGAQRLRLSIALMNPTTWFPPIWAFLCGAAASGHLGDGTDVLVRVLIGIVIAGPVLLGFAQVVLSYDDREADAKRVSAHDFPAAHMSTPRIILIGAILLIIGLVLASILGSTVAILAAVGVLLGIAYGVPPLRFKRNGWLSTGIRSLAFVGLPWLAGTAALSANQLPPISVIFAALFTIGAYGATTVPDFVTLTKGRTNGLRTVPIVLGVRDAAICCCTLISVAQVVVVEFAITQGYPLVGGILALLLLAQWFLQRIWLAQPEAKARWYLSTGVLLAMAAMLVAALGVVAPAMAR